LADDESRQLAPVTSAARELLDAQRQKAGFDALFPEGDRRKRSLINYVARFQGQYPDAYHYLRAGVSLELRDVIRSRALAVMTGNGDARPFDWSRVSNHPLLYALEDLTISMGGGKGRKEGVEMSKSNPPVEAKSRWSWGRKG
jgi:hypothetical protein